MVWNYWYVPGMYAYLRTLPETLLGDLANLLYEKLISWSTEHLGLAQVTWPFLSLYVAGCRQGQHNDARNGRFAFVYSLTRNDRKTTGGETLIWHQQDYFGTMAHKPVAGRGFYEIVEPRFNRLVVFDDRLPHAVRAVEGNMDPTEGRIVLHGHMFEAGPIVKGPLSREAVEEAATTMALDYSAELSDALMLFHGLVVFRFMVRSDGSVCKVNVLVDRVMRLTGDGPLASEVVERLFERVSRLRFPSSVGATLVTLPVAFGNRLGELR